MSPFIFGVLMNKSLAILLSVYTIVFAAFFAYIFVVNFDKWCATPHVGGNYILIPLCK